MFLHLNKKTRYIFKEHIQIPFVENNDFCLKVKRNSAHSA